ncbi:MAG: alanine--glyoxylate aminotransferase family protein [Synergistaceae bacterium]|nr:alanine--glyoxylate aminotransferase family protein [Synergistaceae bacterium]
MERYRIGLIPGPVRIPPEIRGAWTNDYASSDLEEEFFTLYRENQTLIQRLLHTQSDIIITSGEAMSILWAALKCTLRPGEKMLAVSSGLFGEGFADMARAFGAEAEICAFPYDEVPDPQRVREHALRYRPKVITAVHCETPSGTLTPCLAEIGKVAREVGALFVVDFVSSVGGCALDVDACGIDIGLLGSQKVLSLTPCLSVSSVSARAWDVIGDVKYSGYESYLAWRNVPREHYMPYTHDWNAVKALNISLNMIMREGVESACKRHDMAARLCRDLGREMGLRLYPKSEATCSPTVTAFYVPEKFSWPEFDGALREKGLAVGGNYGCLAGKVFRIGHMGSQADCELVREGMGVIREVLAR